MPRTVADAMTPTPIVVKPQTPLNEAIKIMAERRISGLPVVGEDDRLVGILSEADLMWQEAGVTPPAYIMFLDSVIFLQNPATYERDLHKALGQTVGEVMSKNPLSIAADKPLKAAAQLLHDHDIRRLLVVDGNNLVIGILTRGDIVRAMAADQD